MTLGVVMVHGETHRLPPGTPSLRLAADGTDGLLEAKSALVVVNRDPVFGECLGAGFPAAAPQRISVP